MTTTRKSAITPESFDTFGELLRFLRRRAQLTQQELATAAGYSVAQICRFEQNRWLPDQATIAALFVPALDLQNEPAFAARLMQLAATPARTNRLTIQRTIVQSETETIEDLGALEDIPAPPTPNIPRDAALANLRAQLRLHHRLALVGMAGLGKTALSAALARECAQTQPVFWLTFTAEVTTSVDAILRRLALFLVARGQSRAEPILRERRETPMRLDQKISLISAGLTPLRPLLCFDNAQLVQNDSDITQVFQHLIASAFCNLLFISREDVPLPNVITVPMEGLAPTEANALIALIGGALTPDLVERLWNKTGGSPMLIRLAVGQLRGARGDADATRFIAHLERQPQVATYLLDAVLRHLPANTARLASLLSIFRQPVDLGDESLVELLRGTDEHFDYRRAVGELQRRHLIQHPMHASLHPLVRDHFYHALVADLPRRRRLHRLAAEWYDARGAVLEAAHHRVHAGQLTLAVDLVSNQVETLFQNGQALAAAQVIEAMLKQPRHAALKPETRRRLLVARGDLLLLTVRAPDAEASYRDALALAEQANVAPAVRADIMRRLANRLSQRGQRAEAYQLTARALELISPHDTLLRARLAISASSYLHSLLRMDEGEQCAEEALQLANELARVSSRLADEIRARAYYELGSFKRSRGDYAGAIDLWRRTGELANQVGLAHLEISALGSVGGMLYDLGQVAESLQMRNHALARAEALGDTYAVVTFLTHTANNYRAMTDYATALARLDQACDLARQMKDQEGLTLAENQRVTVLIALGRVDESHALIARVVRDSESWLEGRMRCYLRDKLAVTQMLKGQLSEAQTTLRAALALPPAQQEIAVRLRLQTTLALALIADGKADHAAPLLAKPSGDVPLWMELDRQLALAALALAQRDPARVNKIATQVAERARAAGLLYNAERAERLLHAANQPPPLIELPQMIWM